MGERVLTCDGCGAPQLAASAALTQSAEQVARLERELAARCALHCDVSCRELAIKQAADYRDTIARLERTVESLRDAIRTIVHGKESMREFANHMLAASSPDHAGAPEGPSREWLTKMAAVEDGPSVEAGEGETT